jgi:hypothetical protein
MWIDRKYFELIVAERERLVEKVTHLEANGMSLATQVVTAQTQKAKDDITIDWMRHQVNALSKQNALLIAKAAGIHVPVPEIVPTRPGTMTVPDFSSMPSFEDVGDDEANRLGIDLTVDGLIEYTK